MNEENNVMNNQSESDTTTPEPKPNALKKICVFIRKYLTVILIIGIAISFFVGFGCGRIGMVKRSVYRNLLVRYNALDRQLSASATAIPTSAPTTAPATPTPTTAPTAAPAEKEFIRENYGYVSYNDLARNPDDYTGKSLTFSGKVIQVIEDDESVQHRIAVNGDYDTVIFVEYPKSMVASRILDDDWVNIYGRFVGLITYEATTGASITIPGIYLDRIELQ